MTTIKNTFEQQLHQKFGVNVMSLEGVHSAILVDGTHGTDYLDYHDTKAGWIFGVHPKLQAFIDAHGWTCEWRNSEVLDLSPAHDWTSDFSEAQLVSHWNAMCDHIIAPLDHIYLNDDEAFEMLQLTIRQTVAASKNDRYNFDDKWLTLDGYGNPMSFNSLLSYIDVPELEEYLIAHALI
jgi:hypothetical protein